VGANAEIAVVVHAYARREFLTSALRSVAAQSLPRDRFELVVTKSFDDPALDREIARLGAVALHDEDRWNSRCLRRAIRETRAPIVTFLDDDDEFEPNRLERVLAAMRTHQDVGFYRNRVRVIDAEGRPVPVERWRSHERDAALDTRGPIYLPPEGKGDALRLLTQTTTATFNSSSMAIRRELLDGDVGDGLAEARLNADLFFLLAGVLAPRGIYLDDQRLTRYRFYSGNITRKTSWLADAAASHRAMSVLAARHGRADFADWLVGLSVHYERMFRGGALVEKVAAGADRSEVARLAEEYIRFLGDHGPERALTLDVWAAGAYGAAYLLAPRTAGRVARARLAARGFA
jgi:glycosyltransferase involved in cell wall biosynthesis